MNTAAVDPAASAANEERLLLTGCGILQKEVRFLNRKNRWNLDLSFLDSALHCELCRLQSALSASLEKNHDRKPIVLYGTCHPLMDQILSRAGTFRTEGQNCIEQLLGAERFTDELSAGSFFLLEDWAIRWKYITSRTYSDCRPEIIREIFQSDRTHILAVRTPCSSDFSAEAAAVSAFLDVPLLWMDATLDHLEKILQEAIDRKQGERR